MYSFYIIFRLGIILSVVSYGRKNIIYYLKNFKITKIKLKNFFFCGTIFPPNRLLPIFSKMIRFEKS